MFLSNHRNEQHNNGFKQMSKQTHFGLINITNNEASTSYVGTDRQDVLIIKNGLLKQMPDNKYTIVKHRIEYNNKEAIKANEMLKAYYGIITVSLNHPIPVNPFSIIKMTVRIANHANVFLVNTKLLLKRITKRS